MAFARTGVIEAGASEDVTITFDVEDMASCDTSGTGAYVLDATHHFYVDGTAVETKSDSNILRRRMFSKFALEVKAGQTVVLEKFSNVFTSRDKELKACSKQRAPGPRPGPAPGGRTDRV